MKRNDPLKQAIARVVLSQAVDYLPGCIETLGRIGSPPKQGEAAVDAKSRVSAAKTLVDFVTKFIGDAGATEAGSGLLGELAKMEKAAARYERDTDDDDDAEGASPLDAEGGDWSEDPELEGQAAHLVAGQEPDSRNI
ncbi:MAG TPA: hypothetical protein VJP78_09615 [Thermoleophilia bacterium]|nr:hypothetical protein [Thermoleophilia bacterium]